MGEGFGKENPGRRSIYSSELESFLAEAEFRHHLRHDDGQDFALQRLVGVFRGGEGAGTDLSGLFAGGHGGFGKNAPRRFCIGADGENGEQVDLPVAADFPEP